jgi:peptidoglycan/xylan/chitin deacetylase (PgdA/CDA1 family)
MSGRVSITFDDGLASVYWLALAEMERYGVSGTTFVVSDLVGKHYLGYPVMNKKMLLDLSSAGWEIGSHTRTHPNLVSLPDQQLNEELESSKQRLESLVMKPVTSLAYPYGQIDNRIVLRARRHYNQARALSRYPPLRLNSPHPRDRMRLNAMSVCEPAVTLPLHLYEAYLPKPVTRTLHRIFHKRTEHVLGAVAAGPTSLNARVVAKWIRRTRKDAWLILCFHDIARERAANLYSIALREFRDIVRVVAAGSQHVVTIKNGCEDE